VIHLPSGYPFISENFAMRRQSLVRKLVLLVATAVTAGTAVSALLTTWQEVNRYADARRQVMYATAQVFAAAAANSVADIKQQETLEAIRAIGRMPGFLFVQVKTSDGRVLAALGGASRF
jgi:acetylornithine/succinyldiaminopimelate/putrescine aminotransferase